MALEESQDCNWVASGWEAMSFFVFFLYAFKAAVKIVSKFGGLEEVAVGETWDIVQKCAMSPTGLDRAEDPVQGPPRVTTRWEHKS